MQSEADKKTFGILPLIVAVVIVAIGAVVVGNNSLWNMLRSDAEATAQGWGSFIVDRVPQIEKVLSGEQPMEVAAAYLWARNEYGVIRRFIVYNQYGTARLDSLQRDFKPFSADGEPMRSKDAAAVFISGDMKFDFTEERFGDEMRNIAHTIIPLRSNNKPIGVLEVVSDETANWSVLRNQFARAGAEILGLVLLAFLLPGVLYLRRTGQLEFTTRTLQQTAQYDSLTGTLNRAAFTAILNDHIADNSARGLQVAVHFVDLDRFKNINDTLGHGVGDKVLAASAQRLRRLLGTRERLARLGADEFAVSQPYYRASPEVVESLADDIARELARPIFIDGIEIQTGATVGYARCPEDGESVSELVRAADIALARAKETARGRALPFDRSMEAERQSRQRVEMRLRQALAHDQFEIHYQPLFGIDGKVLRGFEALLRLSDENGKPISPVVFIPIAEEIGLIGAIGEWVLTQSARTAREWPDDLMVSVNLSPIQFQSHDMPKVVQDVLERTGLPPRRLELEVTESVLIADTEKVLAELREIKGLGVSIALDDFGTGYSSLGYLWRFPFDKLKVDKSFMTDLAVEGSKSREILATIVALGKVLDLKITAEGVETEEQARVLRSLDCDLVQGFLYGKPLDASHLASLLAERVQSEALERASQRLHRGVGKTAIVSVLKSA